jgi:[ribosomal protein S5]-alanine N-acetyltransferase
VVLRRSAWSSWSPSYRRVDWLEAQRQGDDVFTRRFDIPVKAGWVGFRSAARCPRRRPSPAGGSWGTHLFFDDDGALVGFGGVQGLAPRRRDRGIATAVVEQLVSRARNDDVRVVAAHTLADENASTAVQRRCGFARTGRLHESGGDVWRWERVLSLSEYDGP